jgi:hypothetical protein
VSLGIYFLHLQGFRGPRTLEPLEDDAVDFLKMLANTYPMMQHHFLEELIPYLSL